MMRAFLLRCCVIAVVLLVGLPAIAGDAGLDASTEDPAVTSLVIETQEVRDFLAEHLAPAVTPSSLFEVPVDDDGAVALEAARLRLLLSGLDAGATKDEKAHAKTHPGGAMVVDAAAPEVPADLWAARMDLDRVRLDVYELSADRRRALLAAHAEQQDVTPALSDADRRAADSEAERQKALKTAREARTEAERLVATEEARLLAIDHAQVVFADKLHLDREAMTARREAVLGWQRRVRDAMAGTPADADRTYDELRRALRSARDELAAALDDIASRPSDVPQAGADALANLQIDVDIQPARSERTRVDAEATRLTEAEATLRTDIASQLLVEIDTLNRERLGMLGSLSPEKRDAITGFTSAGLDQASSEVRQLALILRFHKHEIADLVVAARHPSGSIIGKTFAGGAVTLVEWLAAIGAFFWWRRRAPVLLRAWRKRVLEDERMLRLPTPSVGARAIGFVVQVHSPLEWLVLWLVLGWFLPPPVQALLEVRLLQTVLVWTFGAAFVVDAINGIAVGIQDETLSSAEASIAKLRLRSLRVVGRVVVLFGLILVISSMLVGHGTIYSWVFSTCWLASVPIVLVLVEWWKKIVFQRLELLRKKSSFQRWVLAHAHGWTSFVAAAAGAIQLFVSGSVRAVRTWIGRFDLYRRMLAYLFRREMDKLVADRAPTVAAQIPDETFRALGPETPSSRWVEINAHAQLEALADRIASGHGGIVAVVGSRGMGKSRTLSKLATDHASSVSVDTPVEGLDALRALLSGTDQTLDEIAAAFDRSPKEAVLIDDAHRLIQPVIGGLAAFDALLATARSHSESTTWVIALDSVIWQFLERARGARPMFDEIILLTPWREAAVVELLAARNEQAAVTPSFEGLLERLPPNADETDKQEALAMRAADYYRLLWDHATGNPGIVLHIWRRSLGVDAAGTPVVRLFEALDSADLERLPDHAVFVLRAILQLSPAAPVDIAKATMVRPADVRDALRYSEARGYIEETAGRYRVTWTWFRAIRVFLQRRHLLGAS